jgi:hypothetical protein
MVPVVMACFSVSVSHSGGLGVGFTLSIVVSTVLHRALMLVVVAVVVALVVVAVVVVVGGDNRGQEGEGKDCLGWGEIKEGVGRK